MREYVLWYPVRPWTANKDRNMHHMERAKHIKEWRGAFKQLAIDADVPSMNSVCFEILPVLGDRRAQDTANCSTAAKAAIDGIVDAGVIPDDRPPYMQWIKFYPPLMPPDTEKGVSGLLVKIYEYEESQRLQEEPANSRT